jgi:hypothetical protein
VVRPFRHAATLTAAQLVSSWIAASKGLAESRNLAQAQLEAEEKKKGKVGFCKRVFGGGVGGGPLGSGVCGLCFFEVNGGFHVFLEFRG